MRGSLSSTLIRDWVYPVRSSMVALESPIALKAASWWWRGVIFLGGTLDVLAMVAIVVEFGGEVNGGGCPLAGESVQFPSPHVQLVLLTSAR